MSRPLRVPLYYGRMSCPLRDIVIDKALSLGPFSPQEVLNIFLGIVLEEDLRILLKNRGFVAKKSVGSYNIDAILEKHLDRKVLEYLPSYGAREVEVIGRIDFFTEHRAMDLKTVVTKRPIPLADELSQIRQYRWLYREHIKDLGKDPEKFPMFLGYLILIGDKYQAKVIEVKGSEEPDIERMIVNYVLKESLEQRLLPKDVFLKFIKPPCSSCSIKHCSLPSIEEVERMHYDL